MTDEPNVRYVSKEDVCPECGGQWSYWVEGIRYSYLTALVADDRMQCWQCPRCATQWPLGAVMPPIVFPEVTDTKSRHFIDTMKTVEEYDPS